MQTSQDIGELAKALAAAQGEIENVERNQVNPFFKSSYADLAACRKAVRGPLAKHGLSLVQCPSMTEGKLIVTTRLMHQSGQWIEEPFSCPAGDAKPQSLGSATTYLRRYALCGFTGLAADEDDDGNVANGQAHAAKANGNGQPQGQTTTPPRGKPKEKLPTPAAQISPEERFAKASLIIEQAVKDRDHALILRCFGVFDGKKDADKPMVKFADEARRRLVEYCRMHAGDDMGAEFMPALIDGKVITPGDAEAVAATIDAAARQKKEFAELQGHEF